MAQTRNGQGPRLIGGILARQELPDGHWSARQARRERVARILCRSKRACTGNAPCPCNVAKIGGPA